MITNSRYFDVFTRSSSQVSNSRSNRSRSYSVPRSRAVGGKVSVPSTSGRARRPRPGASPPSDPRRAPAAAASRARLRPPPQMAREASPEAYRPTQSQQRGPKMMPNQQQQQQMLRKKKDKVKEKDKQLAVTRIKTERPNKPKQRRRSPAADSSGSEDSSSSCLSAVVASTRLTLSERFGKMAQWSVDRRDIENMRITKNSSSGDLKVMIEAEERMYDSPPMRYSHSPAPIGHYPEELLISSPSGLTAWDDVRVRYQYYKDLGYLRDLTLDDYIKWEQWWYKYQEWLKNERYYEHWLSTQSRRRRKRLPASQRLN